MAVDEDPSETIVFIPFIRPYPSRFTGYSTGIDQSNTLINLVEISCEMLKGGYGFLHAVWNLSMKSVY